MTLPRSGPTPFGEPAPSRHSYRPTGICPSEIEVTVEADRLREVRFRGGGCPGTAALVDRWLTGVPIEEAAERLAGVVCRNGTSCPDQLAVALTEIRAGRLPAAGSWRVAEDPTPRRRVALLGAPSGGRAELDRVLRAAAAAGAEAAYLLGGLGASAELAAHLSEGDLPLPAWSVLGRDDSRRAHTAAAGLPHVLSFRIGSRQGVGFAGEHLFEEPGFSDFALYALEMNMVCRLSGLLREESVFPALEAMTPQFAARVVCFADPGGWRHREVGGVDFVGVGPLRDGDRLTWGLLEATEDDVRLHVEEIRGNEGS